jgi:integrase
MAVIKLTPEFIASRLHCPPGHRKFEFVDDQRTGLYVEVRDTSPGQGAYRVRYKNAQGKTCHEPLGTTLDITLTEARKRASTFRAGLHHGADPRGEKHARLAMPTLGEFFDASYVPYVKPRKRTWKGDQLLFDKRIRPVFGNRRLTEINRQEVQTFHANLLNENIAQATADHYVKLIRQILNRAVEWSVIEANPIARIKLFNPDNRLERYLDAAQLASLVSVLKTDRNRSICNIALLLLSTGARLNEALSAKWVHIDRQSRVWRIPATTSKSKRVRSVPLNDAALDVLAQLDTEGKSDYLFVSSRRDKNGQKTQRLSYPHKVWSRIRAKAGLPNLRIHDLRHAYASFLVNSGRTLFEVQKILGHSSPSVTERYSHLSSKALMEAANSAAVAIGVAMKATEPRGEAV